MVNAIERFKKEHGIEEFCPKLALFDMDGVLYNSMPHHAKAWMESMDRYGIKMTYEEGYAYEGMRGVETIRLLAKRQFGKDITLEEAEMMYKTKSECYARFPKAELIPGVHDLQELLSDKGIRIGVVTGSGQQTLINRILTDFVGLVIPSIIVSANDVKQGKPKPEPYEKGMLKGNALPYQTIVVENAPLGVMAGVAAGCFTIAVNTGPLPDSELSNAGAHIVFHNMHEAKEALSSIL